MIDTSHIASNIDRIRNQIAEAAGRSGRSPEDITLIAVTKTYPVEFITAALHAGVTDSGENRIQEALPKIQALSNDLSYSQLKWHLIGHLQSNKARLAVENFDMIHSVDSLKLAGEINRHAEAADRIMPVLLQVNISGEDSKSGMEPQAVQGVLEQILENYPYIIVDGFMTMAPLESVEAARPSFKGLRELSIGIKSKIKHARFPGTHLSMGMSNDFTIAIEEGATMIRVGSSIFGARDYT